MSQSIREYRVVYSNSDITVYRGGSLDDALLVWKSLKNNPKIKDVRLEQLVGKIISNTHRTAYEADMLDTLRVTGWFDAKQKGKTRRFVIREDICGDKARYHMSEEHHPLSEPTEIYSDDGDWSIDGWKPFDLWMEIHALLNDGWKPVDGRADELLHTLANLKDENNA